MDNKERVKELSWKIWCSGTRLKELEAIADYIEAEIDRAKREVAENFFRHEAVGEYDPADYLRNILKQSEV